MAKSEFRKSQGVVPFGVGAIVDFADESLMMAGLDVWPFEKADAPTRAAIRESCQVLDGRLARRLSSELGRPIEFFLAPTEAPDRSAFRDQARLDRAFMPFVRFPTWYFCPRCRVLKRIPWNAQSTANSLRCSNMGRRVEGKGEPCGGLPRNRRPLMSPVRFVTACENGHVMDFPWAEWAHSRATTQCNPADGNLYLYSTPAAGLAGVVVACVKCGARRSMAGAFQKDALSAVYGNHCPGERPWLGPDGRQECLNALPQTIQRGASNAYFAKVVSSILIPPYSAHIQQILDRPDIWSEIEVLPLVDGYPHVPSLRQKAKNLGLDEEAFVQAVLERLQLRTTAAPEGTPIEITEERYRYDEYKAYTGPRPPAQERHDFDTNVVSAEAYVSWFASFFERVVLVKKLRETRVLTGFSRLVPVEALKGAPAELSLAPKRWLPGFSVRGEGIFLQLNAKALTYWAARAEVTQRVSSLQDRVTRLYVDRGRAPRILSAQLIMIHSLAHLMIRQLAFECGYDSSSIRERLYVSPNADMPMAGLLLYTASGDSEGTLGGLVRQGEPGRLDNTLLAAVRNASICSSDPLCIESTGQGTYSLNLAACHACALLPETSCEEGNLLLDRVLVLGTPERTEIGFFGQLNSMTGQNNGVDTIRRNSASTIGRREVRRTAIDLFSGCGGLTLGLKQANFDVISAIEIDAVAATTYRTNHPEVALKEVDIRYCSPDALMTELRLRPRDLDLLAGCPPCQGFSVLRTKNGARDNTDPRNSLVGELLRFARVFMPKTMMMENVPSLQTNEVFRQLCDGLRALGYHLTYEVKDAAHYGVPQRRRRLILVGGLGFDVKLARKARRPSVVRDAIGDLISPGSSGDALHDLPENRSEKVRKLIRDIPKDGGSRSDLPAGRQLNCHKRTRGFYDVYGRMSWEVVAPTITSGCFNPSKGRFLHPEQDRAITMREAALLQTFPMDYEFDVSRGKEAIALMIGNALPPEFIRRQALSIQKSLSEEGPTERKELRSSKRRRTKWRMFSRKKNVRKSWRRSRAAAI